MQGFLLGDKRLKARGIFSLSFVMGSARSVVFLQVIAPIDFIADFVVKMMKRGTGREEEIKEERERWMDYIG